MKSVFPVFIIMILTACSNLPSDPRIVYDTMDQDFPSLQSYPYCHGYGCRLVENYSLSPSEQKHLRDLFKSVKTAADERAAIAKAIAYMEDMAGAQAGTQTDVAGTYVRLGNDQLDCVDESTNSTTFLVLLNQLGLLKFHSVNALTSRTPILSGRLGPHRTAVIQNKADRTKYAVDSWFHDNGVAPEIIPLDRWRWGWHPES